MFILIIKNYYFDFSTAIYLSIVNQLLQVPITI